MPTMVKPVSDKQQAFMTKLAEERNYPLPEITTSGEASRMIEWLLGQPKVKTEKGAAPASALTAGMYVEPASREIVQVKPTRDGKRLYAQVMVDITGQRLTTGGDVVNWDWQYAPGLVAKIDPAWKMSKETAGALGIRANHCIWCRRPLKDATSVANGYGPICAQYFS